jgi:DNA-binding NarL/FixJ family response regulator
MGARYLALYPRWRAAQAYLTAGDRSSAVGHLREAYRTADDLGAEPIRQVLSTLARRVRLRLDPRTGEAPIPYGLTARELDVLRQLARGITNREIARLLFISERTVDIHVSRILAKVGATRRTEAALIAVRLGLVTG